MSNIAVITARGGSKRIPRKNIRDFCGKPIITYSINAALKSELFDEVMVSTDDKEIATVAVNYGAQVPFYRSESTSNDFATTIDVLTEVIKTYQDQGRNFDYMCCLYPTAPFVTQTKIREAYNAMINKEYDMVIPVVSFSYPPQRSFRIGKSGCLEYCCPEYEKARSQDLEPLYHDVGQFYWYNVDRCFGNKIEQLRTGMIIISESEAQDIDNESDWEIAEMKFKMLREKEK